MRAIPYRAATVRRCEKMCQTAAKCAQTSNPGTADVPSANPLGLQFPSDARETRAVPGAAVPLLQECIFSHLLRERIVTCEWHEMSYWQTTRLLTRAALFAHAVKPERFAHE